MAAVKEPRVYNVSQLYFETSDGKIYYYDTVNKYWLTVTAVPLANVPVEVLNKAFERLTELNNAATVSKQK